MPKSPWIAILTITFGALTTESSFAGDCASELGAGSSASDIIACLKEKETEIAALKRERKIDPLVPVGAVVAFDEPRGCPEGWRDMGPSWGGSTLVAAVRDANNTFGFRRTGGARTHSLTMREMPRHSHRTDHALSGTSLQWWDSSKRHPVPVSAARSASRFDFVQGGGEPHNNMPPYIALYFCKKEGR